MAPQTKSILKTKASDTQRNLTPEQQEQYQRDQRNLGIALYHANKIQDQKNWQIEIVDRIERLISLPTTATYSVKDADMFLSAILPFQPSDFTSLVEERNIDGRCGYALCAQQPRSITMGANAAWKLPAEEYANYCSNECVRKALYVRTQLSEVPIWERASDWTLEIALIAEPNRPDAVAPPTSASSKRDEELALERGEATSSLRPNQVMTERIVEKRSTAKPSLLDQDAAKSGSHRSIEGYEPKVPKPVPRSKTLSRNSSEDEDELARQLFDDIDERGVGAQWRDKEGKWHSTWNGKDDSDDER
jgi:RNA polymerase II-associated protein 2